MSNWEIKDQYFEKVYGNSYKPKNLTSVTVLSEPTPMHQGELFGEPQGKAEGEVRESTKHHSGQRPKSVPATAALCDNSLSGSQTVACLKTNVSTTAQP